VPPLSTEILHHAHYVNTDRQTYNGKTNNGQTDGRPENIMLSV